MKMKNKKTFSALLAIFSVAGLFFLVAPVHASGWAEEVIAGLIGAIISALGLVLGLIMQALISVAQYSDFIHAPAVTNGWVAVRDVCNMFFVLILLIIAFATILKIENYSYKKWLPKLILMAILINFSKTICGLLIDFAQVVMLTFVNAFKDMAAANLVQNLGLTQILTLAKSSNSATFWQVVGAYVLGLIYVIIAIVVVTTMLAMLVMRIVMIWVYVVLSPVAYLMGAFPGGQKYSSQWWSEFSKNLIVGPVLAFFIWLSFVSMQTDISSAFPGASGTSTTAVAQSVNMNNYEASNNFAASEASTPAVFMKFIIAIGMLIGGLKVSQEIGGAAGGIAGKGMAKINSGASFVGKKASGFALNRAKAVGGAIGRSTRNTALLAGSQLSQGAGSLMKKAGDLAGRKMGNNAIGRTLNKIGNKSGEALAGVGGIGMAWREDMQKANQKRKVDKKQKFLEKIGMGENTMAKTDEFLRTDTGKELSTAAHAGGVGLGIGTLLGPLGALVATLGGFVVGGAFSKAHGDMSKGYADTSKLKQDEADDLHAQAEQARNNGDIDEANRLDVEGNKAGDIAKDLKNLSTAAASVQGFTSDLTQKGAANGSKEIKSAKKQVEVLKNDPDAMEGPDGFSPATFYTKSGQTSSQKKFFQQLSSKENADSPDAIRNMADWASTANMADDKTENRMNALARGIAAFKKGGGDTSTMGTLIAAVNARTAGAGGIGTIDSLDPKVIANRMTGKVGEQGSGTFDTDTFSQNDKNEAGKNVIGVDFNKLADSGLDTKAEAVFSSGDAMAPLIKAVSAQIDTAKANLAEEHNIGNMSSQEYAKKNNELDTTKQRLNDPNLSNLNLVNTGSANYGRKEKMTSVYHEEIHAGGIEDEDLTEKMAQNLTDNKLYGRNAATKGRHATEIAQMAKGMKDKGMNNDDIMAEVDKEVKSRVSAEGSRAKRVSQKESGAKETESQATVTSGEEKKEVPKIDTTALQESLDSLTSKVQKSMEDFKLNPVSLGGAAGMKNSGPSADLTYAVKTLRKAVLNNTTTLKKYQKTTGGKTPSTVIEADAIMNKLNT